MDFDTYERTAIFEYAEFAEMASKILAAGIASDPTLRLQQMQARAKSPKSLKKKLLKGNLLDTLNLENEIKDLAGCRAIFYTNSDVTRFVSSGLIQDNFEVLEARLHYPKNAENNDVSLYISQHFVLKFRPERLALIEYAQFSNMRFELQIQTILNHAWSEMEHDIGYKEPTLDGFGGALYDSIKERLRNIMRRYLLPAGYEFQKVASDFDRLISGKKLFDENVLEVVVASENNNERVDNLERLADHVLPFYNDLNSIYPEILLKLVDAVKQARKIESSEIETPFGSLPGKTFGDVIEGVAGILQTYRCLDIERTFDVICEIFVETRIANERTPLIELSRGIAKYEMKIWAACGTEVQKILLVKIKALPPDLKDLLSPMLMAMLDEMLKTEVTGTTHGVDTLTLHRHSIGPSEDLRLIRHDSIELLKEFFIADASESVRREIAHILMSAKFTSDRHKKIDLLEEFVMQDACNIIEFYAQSTSDTNYELLETLEEDALRTYRYYQGATCRSEGATEFRSKLLKSLLLFRDCLNGSSDFVIYKTLVGFESVFPPEWDRELSYEEKENYRDKNIEIYLNEINEENAEFWFDIVKRCAKTESNDNATFLKFADFLQKLSEKKPEIVISYIGKMDHHLARFLNFLLIGLFKSSCQERILSITKQWVTDGQYLEYIAHYFKCCESIDQDLINQVFKRALELENDVVVTDIMGISIFKYKQNPTFYLDELFFRALAKLDAVGNTKWVDLAKFSIFSDNIFEIFDSTQAETVLDTLIAYPKIEYGADAVVTNLAKKWPNQVIDFLGRRDSFSRGSDQNGYQAFPSRTFHFKRYIAAASEYLIECALQWFYSDENSFQYNGGAFLSAIFPEFSPALTDHLERLVRTKDRRKINFVVAVISQYQGESFLHDLCKKIVESLEPDDDLLNQIMSALRSTGVVMGEYGFAEAYAEKKAEMELWLEDDRPKVVAFAKDSVFKLDH